MKSWKENNKLLTLEEARPTYRTGDIQNVEIYSINFPVKNGNPEGEERSFASAEHAARELIRQGKTESDKVMSVARNIFAAAMACEGREDRNSDRRWSAYKNDAGDTILWAFADPNDLSPENREIYMEQHPNSSASNIAEPEEITKCKVALGDPSLYESFKEVENQLGFHWPTFPKKARYAAGGTIEIPINLNQVGKTLKFQYDKNKEDKTRAKALKYAIAISRLQKQGWLPTEPPRRRRSGI